MSGISRRDLLASSAIAADTPLSLSPTSVFFNDASPRLATFPAPMATGKRRVHYIGYPFFSVTNPYICQPASGTNIAFMLGVLGVYLRIEKNVNV